MIIDVRRLDAVRSWTVVPSNKKGSIEIDELIAVNFGKRIVAVYEDRTIYGINPKDASTYTFDLEYLQFPYLIGYEQNTNYLLVLTN